jgi:hypothetical protein
MILEFISLLAWFVLYTTVLVKLTRLLGRRTCG